MTEDPPTPTQDPPKPTQEPEEIKDLVIKFEGMETLPEETLNQINSMFQQMSGVMETQQQQINTLKKESTDAQKAVVLDRLAQAGYDTELLKEMDISSLNIMIKALSTKDGTIRIPEQPSDPQPPPSTDSMIEVYVPGEGYISWEEHRKKKIGNKS